jgi:methyl-accepting chemotaxis protein
VFAQYVRARPRWFELQNAGKFEEAAEWRAKTTTPYGAGSVKALSRLIELQRVVGEKKHLEAAARMAWMTKMLISLLLTSLVDCSVSFRTNYRTLLAGPGIQIAGTP